MLAASSPWPSQYRCASRRPSRVCCQRWVKSQVSPSGIGTGTWRKRCTSCTDSRPSVRRPTATRPDSAPKSTAMEAGAVIRGCSGAGRGGKHPLAVVLVVPAGDAGDLRVGHRHRPAGREGPAEDAGRLDRHGRDLRDLLRRGAQRDEAVVAEVDGLGELAVAICIRGPRRPAPPAPAAGRGPRTAPSPTTAHTPPPGPGNSRSASRSKCSLQVSALTAVGWVCPTKATPSSCNSAACIAVSTDGRSVASGSGPRRFQRGGDLRCRSGPAPSSMSRQASKRTRTSPSAVSVDRLVPLALTRNVSPSSRAEVLPSPRIA